MCILNKFNELLLGVQTEVFNFFFKVGEWYRLDIFMAERFTKDSVLFLQTSGVNFVRQWDKSTLPLDYISEISEDTHVGSIVQVCDIIIVIVIFDCFLSSTVSIFLFLHLLEGIPTGTTTCVIALQATTRNSYGITCFRCCG